MCPVRQTRVLAGWIFRPPARYDFRTRAEGYPDLKAGTNFLELQKELTDIEDQIQMARRYYNGTVRNLNIAIESFPSNIVAGVFGFAQAEFFALDEASDRQAPRVTMG